ADSFRLAAFPHSLQLLLAELSRGLMDHHPATVYVGGEDAEIVQISQQSQAALPATAEKSSPQDIPVFRVFDTTPLDRGTEKLNVTLRPVTIQTCAVANFRIASMPRGDEGPRIDERPFRAHDETEISGEGHSALHYPFRSHAAANLKCGCLL